MTEGDGTPAVPDVPTGPTEGTQGTHPDAPDLPADQAGDAAKGSQTGHPRGGGPQTAERTQPGDRGPGAAEEILPAALDVESRPDRGSDSDSPVAGLLAAAAASPQPLDERAYRDYRESHGGRWPTIEELERRYGSFAAAMRAAGIVDPGRN